MFNKIRLVFDPMVNLEELKKAYVLLAMDHFDGNKTQVANALGITIKTLYTWLDGFGIQEFKGREWVKGQADPMIAAAVLPVVDHDNFPGTL
jgi:Bacterial regulatory protein, Fis family